MMTPFQKRAKDQLPTVIMTLLSIMQALALELLWTFVGSHSWLFAWTFNALLTWMQIASTLVGIIVIWLIYVTNAIRFRWQPAVSDLMLPFAVGILEFTLVETMGPDTLPLWFLTHAVIFGLMVWISQSLLRRARLDGENDAYFANIPPAKLKDFYGSIFIVCALLAVSLWFYSTASIGWDALLAVTVLTLLLTYQGVGVSYYYNASMRGASLQDVRQRKARKRH